MTDTEINIAIAEACGWKLNDDHERPGIGKWWEKDGENPRRITDLPDYCGDLNAIVRVVITLKPEQHEDYLDWLDTACGGELEMSAMLDGPEFVFSLVNATARQRAEAFLRTLSLWKS